MTAAIETTLHAYDRYREHHADASEADLIAAIRAGEPVDADLVWALTQRTRKPDPTDTFRIAPDQWGIFVLSGSKLITYLRLGAIQRSVLTGEPLPGSEGSPDPNRKRAYQCVTKAAIAEATDYEVRAVAWYALRQRRINDELRLENDMLRARLLRIQKAMNFPEDFEL